MTITDERKALYRANYGRAYIRNPPDYSKCCESVADGYSNKQCSRSAGYGPHGAYCKQHDPEAKAQKRADQSAKWRAEWDANARQSAFERDCQDAIRQIAAGHNDPAGLARSIIAKLEGVK